MSKEYGLIIPSNQKNKTVHPTKVQKSSVFGNESSSESSNEEVPKVRGKHPTQVTGPGAVERRQARAIQQKALAEDPTIFQYDELYDEIETKREQEKKQKSSEERKPKYISKLLQQAERRKLENERRIERQVQKEREAEGEQFKDKESFVTTAYKKKLEELKIAEEAEKREEYLEAIGDVKKQGNLDGFYRHLYEQKLGIKETENRIINEKLSENKDPQQDETLKVKQNIKPRIYRKRMSSDDSTENENLILKKGHIQSNLDADSDFSIDDSTSDDDTENNNNVGIVPNKIVQPIENDLNNDEMATENKDQTSAVEIEVDQKSLVEEKQQKPKEKINVWKKRTVGEIFDTALQRYYERKNARKSERKR